MPSLTIGGASHNVVFIATEHDSVFAFDADAGGVALWHANLLDSAHGAAVGATTNPDSESGCYTANYEYGITGTPVIDSLTGTLYVVSGTLENNYPLYRLHAIDVYTGLEKFGGPATISASVPGTGTGSSNGILTFNPGLQLQRAGLALVNGMVYVAFGSYCDLGAYHGWLFAYDAATLAQTSVFLPTPNGVDSGLWMGGAAPAAETINGITRMFLATGNGTYDATTPYATNTMDYGDDILQLNLSGGIRVADAFTPLNQATLMTTDADVGSGGVLILPDQPGNYPHLLIGGGKGGDLYLVNRDQLGGYSTATNNIVQELDNLANAYYGLPAYWNGNVYLWPPYSQLLQLSLTNGLLSSTPVLSTYYQSGGHGSTPSISANGSTNGIVWSIDSSQSVEVLYAHDATNVANMLWNSALNSGRDSAGNKLTFVVPTIANGRVYVGSVGQVSVYGLYSTVAQTITFGAIAAQAPGTTLTLTATASSGLTVAFSSSTPSICTVSGSTTSLLMAGICTITASQAGNGTYLPATSVSQSFTVGGQSTAPPPNVAYVGYWAINDTGITVSWSTDMLATTQLAYGTTTTLGQLSPLQTTASFNHGVVLTTLNPGTTYYFVAQSTAANGATGYSSVYSFTTTGVSTIPAPAISSVTVINISTTSATITWTTDEASSSQVNYGATSAYGTSSTPNTNLVTSHSVTLNGLTAGTAYDFDVVSANSSNIAGTSGNSTFTTTGSAPIPVISNLATSGITTAAVTITWTTDQATSSLVNYGTTTSYSSSSTPSSNLVTSHSVTLTGLTAGTVYNFDVFSANSGGLSVTSANSTFSTTTVSGPPPNVGYLGYWAINDTGLTISWSTDMLATTQLAYGTTTALGQLSSLQTTPSFNHGVVLTTLNPGTTYYFVAQSTAANGATGYSSVYSFTTTGVSTIPAPAISGVTVINISGTSATITWTTDQASSSQVNYGATSAYGTSSTPNTSLVTSHSVTLKGLTAGTNYDFDVVSANSSNIASTSGNSTFTTTGSAPIPVISNLVTSGISTAAVTITWTTDQATSSLVNYGTTTPYSSSSTPSTSLVTSHSVTLTGLTAGTVYDFDVVSANSGGLSVTSANSTFSTTTVSGPPPNLGYLGYWAINDTGLTISWSTDMLATTQLAYGTTTALGQLSPLQTTPSFNHGVVLTTLNPGTTYYFVAQSTAANGATGYSSVYSFTTTGVSTIPAPAISGVTVINISGTSATITWTTDQASSSQVNYGATSAYGTSSTPNTNLVTSHSVTLNGLTAGTAYDFDVVSANSSSIVSTSGNSTFTTTGSAPIPVISNLVTSGISTAAVTITWTTDQATSSLVNYGTTTSYTSSSTLNTNLVTSHSVTLTGLTAGTIYDFDVVSANSGGLSVTSANSTFATTTVSGPPPNLGYLGYWAINDTGITVSWSTDMLATTQLAYGTATALGQLSPLQTTPSFNHGLVLTTLNPGTTYYFVAQSTAANGATGYSTMYSFTTTGTAGTH